jgi:hypothetical protein
MSGLTSAANKMASPDAAKSRKCGTTSGFSPQTNLKKGSIFGRVRKSLPEKSGIFCRKSGTILPEFLPDPAGISAGIFAFWKQGKTGENGPFFDQTF